MMLMTSFYVMEVQDYADMTEEEINDDHGFEQISKNV